MTTHRNPKNTTVVVGLSGGVDSSVAALLLQDQGYRVIGVTMKIWDGGGGSDTAASSPLSKGTPHACYGPGEEEEIEDARTLAAKIGIPFHVIDLTKAYKDIVLTYFKQEYLCGRTPNPCVRCNSKIKFGALLDELAAQHIAFNYFATGHYVNVAYDATRQRHVISRANDPKKDQSYFLFYLTQTQLARCLFPLGPFQKDDVKAISRDRGLGAETKAESQNFIASGYTSLLEGTAQAGPILDQEGRVLGEHNGIYHYTIGQRRRLGIASPEPYYVVAIDASANAVIVGRQDAVYQDILIASDLNWVSIETLNAPLTVTAKIRYVQHEAEATLHPLEDGRVKVTFTKPQLAITPGQAVVFYDRDWLVGGGIIQTALDSSKTTDETPHL